MVLGEKIRYHLDRVFELSEKDGLTFICVAIDPIAEGSELLFNPKQLELEQARNIIETFVDCTRQELEDVNGSTEENLIH